MTTLHHCPRCGKSTDYQCEGDWCIDCERWVEGRRQRLRDLDGMSDAIALSSPSGRMSKRARRDAERRLSLKLFGPNGLQREPTPQPTKRERLLAQAKQLRELAERGMSVRKFTREAERLEAEADTAT